GEPYTLRNVDIDVADTVLGNRYAEQWATTSHIQPGSRYDADLLVAERERVYHFLRQRGYYEYLRQYMRVDVDSSLRRNQADVRLIVDNPEGQANHTKFNIDSSFVVISHDRPDLNQPMADEVVLDGQIAFQDYTGRFRAAPIARYLFLRQGSTYNANLENLTYDRLYELNGFRNVKINYEKVDSN